MYQPRQQDQTGLSLLSILPYQTQCYALQTLQLYLNHTVDWRQNMEKTRFFLSLIRPDHPVTSATIAHWLKQLLKETGVAIWWIFSPLYKSSSSFNSLWQGCDRLWHMKMADWLSESVFKKFYYKSSLSLTDLLMQCFSPLLMHYHVEFPGGTSWNPFSQKVIVKGVSELWTTHRCVKAGASKVQLMISPGSAGPALRSRLYEEVTVRHNNVPPRKGVIGYTLIHLPTPFISY